MFGDGENFLIGNNDGDCENIPASDVQNILEGDGDSVNILTGNGDKKNNLAGDGEG